MTLNNTHSVKVYTCDNIQIGLFLWFYILIWLVISTKVLKRNLPCVESYHRLYSRFVFPVSDNEGASCLITYSSSNLSNLNWWHKVQGRYKAHHVLTLVCDLLNDIAYNGYWFFHFTVLKLRIFAAYKVRYFQRVLHYSLTL